MRGKGVTDEEIRHTHGITPAYAGKSRNAGVVVPLIGDHPRLCGEKARFRYTRVVKIGSPPPMRGKAPAIVLQSTSSGITPAYAGKSQILWISDRSQEDHPRLCGEKQLVKRCGKMALGSPPPMRGKVTVMLKTIMFLRITPAYAGKSYMMQTTSQTTTDHPRLCGEKTDFSPAVFMRLGSPPPMRGKERRCGSPQLLRRITPAYAGKRFEIGSGSAPS